MKKPEDHLERKSRWDIPHATDVVLQPRDLDILLVVFELGYVTGSLIRQLVSPQSDPAPFSRRLRALTAPPNFYISRPEQQKANYLANSTFLTYSITEKGIKELLAAARITPNDVRWRSALMRTKYREFWHDLALGNVVGSIRLAIRDNPALFYISPFELLGRKAPRATRESASPFTVVLEKGRKITPDYLFGIGHKGEKDTYRVYWLEHDQGTEPVLRTNSHGSSFDTKLKDCDEMLTRNLDLDQFGIDDCYIMTTTPNARHMQSIMERVDGLTNPSRFLFKAAQFGTDTDRVPKPDPKTVFEPWLRHGAKPFDLDKP